MEIKANFIQIADKYINRAYREALKLMKENHQNLLGDTSPESQKERNRLLKEKTQNCFDDNVKRLDLGLTLALKENGLVDVLEKHGFKLRQPVNEKLTGKWFFITLRPAPEHEHRFIEFKPMVFKYMERTMFIKWMLAFEQKGESTEEMGKGYHVHIIANCAGWCTKKKMITDTKSTWDKWLNGYVPDAFVQIDKVETTTEKNVKELYITGNKKEEHKKKAITIDNEWRSSIGLQPTYCSPAYQVQERG